jgi:polyphosphate kinase 2
MSAMATEHATKSKKKQKTSQASDAEGQPTERLPKKAYDRELRRLQEQLVRMGEWVRESGARVVVVFEGRDAAGKGGTIKRITEFLNPRVARIAALPIPTEREKTQWYFQRYVEHLPAAGEIVIFDRSWYNRAGIETVLGFCTPEEHLRFLRQAPDVERLLVEDGIHLVKYWFSVSDEEQRRRFEARIHDPMKRWKLSSTDLSSRTHWVDYSRAKDEMFVHTDIPEAPWWVVEADDKRRARINCMSHLLTTVPWKPGDMPEIKVPKRQSDDGYRRPEHTLLRFVPDAAAALVD